ncbi:MAG: tyrosine--tRNA ligase [Flavobacteriaceae bacterium]|nr:tyrosine--tRNA ligase [Flavobacteriaceae bacterium]
MENNFIGELKWRGLIQDITPETNDQLNKESTTGYIGFDPTSDSLHIGSLVQIIILMHFQKYGHKPIALIGGATGMIGDPSGKSEERNLLDLKTLEKNIVGLKNQLEKFLDFNYKSKNAAKVLNNYDWIKNYTLIDFSRDIGKHITVNYMMSKDSVKTRISSNSKQGMSFTEFTYQLLQGYDFLNLYEKYDCKLQMGGSDQWGNITTGIELVRRKLNSKAYAMTCPLITKVDGSKFGKTEEGNIWLDKSKTSPYKFYQYWLNSSDIDTEKYIRIFTFLSKNEIISLVKEHRNQPHLRILQKKIAQELTLMVHSRQDLDNVEEASKILFGSSTSKDLNEIDEKTFFEIFEGIPLKEITLEKINNGISMIEAFSSCTNFLNSNAEARRALNENSISVNKVKVSEEYVIGKKDLINKNYILLQKGKKQYFIIKVK